MAKTIVFLGMGDLLSSSVERILAAQEDWEIVRLPTLTKPVKLLQAVTEHAADVVVIQRGEEDGMAQIPTLLLKDHPDLHVVMLNPNDNQLEVYCVRNVTVQSSSDLITVIETAADVTSR